jgi:hypothetical protein
MIIKGTQTERKTVEISVHPRDIFVELANKALKVVDTRLNINSFVDDKGRIAENVTYHTSHSWDEDVVQIAEPTEEQIKAIQTVKWFRALVDKIKDER